MFSSYHKFPLAQLWCHLAGSSNSQSAFQVLFDDIMVMIDKNRDQWIMPGIAMCRTLQRGKYEYIFLNIPVIWMVALRSAAYWESSVVYSPEIHGTLSPRIPQRRSDNNPATVSLALVSTHKMSHLLQHWFGRCILDKDILWKISLFFREEIAIYKSSFTGRHQSVTPEWSYS